MITAIWTIVIFCALVAIHEFGHFITAKLSGITVHEFAIGMGPKLFGFQKGGTKYTLRLLPIGGYCQMEGEDGDSADQNAFCNKAAWKRLIVLVAGAAMNLLLGFVIYCMVISTGVMLTSNQMGAMSENSAVADAGFLPGDRIVYAQGEAFSSKIRNYNDLSFFLMRNGNRPVTLTVERDGQRISGYVELRYDQQRGQYLFGFNTVNDPVTVSNVLKYGWWESCFAVKMVVYSIGGLITGQVPISDLSGPVGIVSAINTSAKHGVTSVLYLAALISINLGIANLLPIPALDGGRVLFLAIEKVRRKKMKPEHEGMINMIGFALLMLLIVVVTVGDVRRIFGG